MRCDKPNGFYRQSVEEDPAQQVRLGISPYLRRITRVCLKGNDGADICQEQASCRQTQLTVWESNKLIGCRYGREDLLALMGKDAKPPPDGLSQCPFFVEKAQTPIILLPLSEAELRLQQNNFNSSKALSSLSRQDRHTALHSTLNGEGGSPSSGGWTLAGIIELLKHSLKLHWHRRHNFRRPKEWIWCREGSSSGSEQVECSHVV